jgi:hypothetical protein
MRANQKTGLIFGLVLILASCNKKQEQPDLGPTAGSNPRTKRANHLVRDVPNARDQLREAFEKAKAREPGADRNTALSEVASNALVAAPEIASDAIHELPAGIVEKQTLIEAYIHELVADDRLEEAKAWANSLGEERDITLALQHIALFLAESKPEQVANLLSTSEFTAAEVDPTAKQILQSWVTKKPDDAVAWTTHLPAGEARTAGFRVVFSQWLRSDSSTALAWAASQTNPSVRREAINAMAGAFSELPDPLRSSFLENADPTLRAEIEGGLAEISRQTQPNVIEDAVSEQESSADSPQR